jgi:hypothetical protein
MPLTLLAIEWVLRREGLMPVVAFALAVMGCVLVGMPEPIFIILTPPSTGGTYGYSPGREWGLAARRSVAWLPVEPRA